MMICFVNNDDRQTTPFDPLCYAVDSDGCQLGSRVFGDCDALMRRVMHIMLSPDEIHDWELAVDDRLLDYSKQRHHASHDSSQHSFS